MRAVSQLEQKGAVNINKQNAIAAVKKAVSALLGKLDGLAALNSVSGKTATVSGTGLTAATTPGSQAGSFVVDILKLATATRTAGTPISAGLDATKPMNTSNFGTVPTNGTFTIATATGGAQTFTVGAAAAQNTSLLSAANFDMAVTAGMFTIATATGGSQTLTIDPATQTLDDVITAINGSGIGVTATITNDANGRANQITLTSTQGEITPGAAGDSSNFLAATNLLASTGTTTRTSSAAFTRQMTLNDVIADINGSAIGVTASITNDVNGRPSILSVSSSQGNISFGNGGDTSNFLAATGLLTSAPGTTRSSPNPLARLSLSARMDAAGFNGGAPAAGDHSITINGVQVAYNAANDSLTDLINRINSSNANVTAKYDSQSDTVKLQNKATGALSLTVADDGAGGDLAAKLGLPGGVTTAGENAEYTVDGGPLQSSATNTIGYNGTTLTMTALSAGSPATVTVSQDTAGAANAVKAFVTEFNSVMSVIDAATKADGSKTNNQSGPLSGDSTLRQLKSDLRTMVSSTGPGLGGPLTTLAQVGISFGAIGSAIGTTNTLQFDEAKFKEALTNNAPAVQDLLNKLTLSASLEPAGTGSIIGISGSYSGAEAGRYTVTDDGAGNLQSVFTPANGGPPVTSSAVVVAGGTNTSLIPGMTLAIAPAFQAGAHTVAVSAAESSVIQRLRQYAQVQTGAGGVLDKRNQTYTRIGEDIADRIATMESRIEHEMELLRKKFASMEQAQARAQGIIAQLQQTATRISSSGQDN